MAKSNMIWAAEIGLCLQELSLPSGFIGSTLQQMAETLATMDKESPEFKELSYYAQILHGAAQSLEAAKDIVSGLSLLMYKQKAV